MEPRFTTFNEVKEQKGARDRPQQEIFLCENKVALQELPLDDLFDRWTQKQDAKAKSIKTFLRKDLTSAKFMGS